MGDIRWLVDIVHFPLKGLLFAIYYAYLLINAV